MKHNKIILGVDIGGGHITSAVVDTVNLKVITGTLHSAKIDNKASKEAIFFNWCEAINKTLYNLPKDTIVNIGFAMPGPFNYKDGIAILKNNDKYESLYNVSIQEELVNFINAKSVNMRFINDATAFGVGASLMGKAKKYKKAIAITLGTGFGSTFIKSGIPQINSPGVPQGGCLWNKPFKDGIADDYFSTRWCIKRYYELTSVKVSGVKEIADINNAASKKLFNEFGVNMAEFLTPFLKKFNPDVIVLGGNVSLANAYFLPVLKERITNSGLHIKFEISKLMEEAALIGGAKLFDPNFWNQVKTELPIN